MFTRGDGINATKPTIFDSGAGTQPTGGDFQSTWAKFKEAALEANPAEAQRQNAAWEKAKDLYQSMGEDGIDLMNDMVDAHNAGEDKVWGPGSQFSGRVPRDKSIENTLEQEVYTPSQRSSFFTARQPPVDYDRFEHIVENAVSNLLNPVIASMTVEPGNDQETDQEISEVDMDRTTMQYLATTALQADAPPPDSRVTQAPTVSQVPGAGVDDDVVAGLETGDRMSPYVVTALGLLAASGAVLVLWKLSKSSSRGGQTL